MEDRVKKLNEICTYISSCSDRELYFIQKSIEITREKNTTKMFQGPTKL